jgi:hypothetical protein
MMMMMMKKERRKETTENNHTAFCTNTSEGTNVEIQGI